MYEFLFSMFRSGKRVGLTPRYQLAFWNSPTITYVPRSASRRCKRRKEERCYHCSFFCFYHSCCRSGNSKDTASKKFNSTQVKFTQGSGVESSHVSQGQGSDCNGENWARVDGCYRQVHTHPGTYIIDRVFFCCCNFNTSSNLVYC